MKSIKQIWLELENYYIANYLKGLEYLGNGATDEEIDSVEEELGYNLPTALRESLKIHNGSRSNDYRSFYLLNCQDIVSDYMVYKDLCDEGDFDDEGEIEGNPGVQPVWWDYGWIPFANDCGGNQYCVDMNPAEDGVYGQVITVWHDEESRPVVARGYHEFLNGVLNNLLAGNTTIQVEGGCIFLTSGDSDEDYDDELANN